MAQTQGEAAKLVIAALAMPCRLSTLLRHPQGPLGGLMRRIASRYSTYRTFSSWADGGRSRLSMQGRVN